MKHVFLYVTKKEAIDCELICIHAGLKTIKSKINERINLVKEIIGNDVPDDFPVVLILKNSEAVSLILEIKSVAEHDWLFSNRWSKLYDTLLDNYLSSIKRHIND